MRIALLLALLSVGYSDGTEAVVGRAGEDITLPCSYDSKQHGNLSVCWALGDLPSSGACSGSRIIGTDGQTVSGVSSRYQLLGQLDRGDVSMTIRNLTKTDAGRYGCRVEIPGWFNDAKHHFDLTVEEAPQTTTSAPNTETTPTEKTERTTAGQSTGQMISTESCLTSPDRTSSLETGVSPSALVCVVFALIVLVIACGVIVVVRKRRQLNKIPQQLHSSSTLQLQHRGSAVENIYQIDGGEYDYCP